MIRNFWKNKFLLNLYIELKKYYLFILGRRLSDKQKEQLTQEFINGKHINDLVEQFCSTKLTISRYLKKNLGAKTYQSLIEKSKTSKSFFINQEISSSKDNVILTNDKDQKRNISYSEADNSNFIEEESDFAINDFVEVAPLNYEIENIPQKDLSSC